MRKTSTEIFDNIQREIDHINKLNEIRAKRNNLKVSSNSSNVKKQTKNDKIFQ